MNKGDSGSDGNTHRDKQFFSVSSAIKDLVGRELVSNRYVAVLELVKNSYDAYAKEARIFFKYSHPKNGDVERIFVIDDGKGMSREDLLNKWLVLAYSEKREQPEDQGRFIVGRKGVGRFSCDRLGETLEIHTKKTDDEQWHHLKVDWRDFQDKQSILFNKIPVELNESPMPPHINRLGVAGNQGTILEIGNVRDKWLYEDLFSLRRHLERMINPYQALSDFKISLAAPAFIPEDKKQEARNESHWKELAELEEDDNKVDRWKQKGPVNGKIENRIIDLIRVKSPSIRSKICEGYISTEIYEGESFLIRTVEKSSFSFLGWENAAESIETEVFYLDREAKNIFTRIMGMRPVDFGSIHVYKNAFRVFPYGQEGDDWLELDRNKGQGWRRTLSTRDILGRVSITDKTNTFKEVSNRQGFYEESGSPFVELKEYMDEYVIRRLTRYVVDAIGWSSDKSELDPEESKIEKIRLVNYIVGKSEDFVKVELGDQFVEVIKEKEIQKVPELVKGLESLVSVAQNDEERGYLQATVHAIKAGVKELNKNLKIREKEVLFLEKSTSLRGPISQMMEHELVIAGDEIFPMLEEMIRDASNSEGTGKLLEQLHTLYLSVRKMVKIAELSLSAKFELRTEIVEEDPVSFIRQYISIMTKAYLDSKGISVEFIGKSSSSKKKIHYVELSIILDNLISNSVKAGCRNIIVKLEGDDAMVSMIFSDDGDGVSEEMRDLLFAPGVSTRGGTGIGMYTMKRICEAQGWSIQFLGNSIEGMCKGAAFEVIL